MTETRKLAAILVSDVAGYSRLAGADEDRTLARLVTLRSDLIELYHLRPPRARRQAHRRRLHHRVPQQVDAVRCAVEVQTAMIERNAGVPPEKRIEFRVGVHLGDVVEESDGDLMGDGVNIAARLEAAAEPGGICLSGGRPAVRSASRLDLKVSDLGPTHLKNIAEPVRVYALEVGKSATPPPVELSGPVAAPPKERPARRACDCCECACRPRRGLRRGIFFLLREGNRVIPKRPRRIFLLVVLPFTNPLGRREPRFISATCSPRN